MFCPSCGHEVNPGLSYCNQCGVRLGPEMDTRALPASTYNLLVGGAIGIPIFGLVLIIGLIAALKNGMGFRDDFIFAISMLTFFLLAIAEIGCFVMLLGRSRAPKSKPRKDQQWQFADAPMRGLASSAFEPVPVGSVTDHTTRALDHAARTDRGE
ncbi:MAG TPA: zinc ribbon domain-containing protein [Pyrinomonadaceae bacterium]